MKKVVLIAVVVMMLSGCVKETTEGVPESTMEVTEQFFCIDDPNNEYEYMAVIGNGDNQHEVYFTPSNIKAGVQASNVSYGRIKFEIQEGVFLTISQVGAAFHINNIPVFVSDSYSVAKCDIDNLDDEREVAAVSQGGAIFNIGNIPVK